MRGEVHLRALLFRFVHPTPPHRKQLTLVLSLPVRHQVYKKRESSRAGYTDATSNQIVPS
jgi:hypothetical protein